MTDPIPLVAQIAEVRREIEFRTREYADCIREKHRMRSIYRDTPTSEIEREGDLLLRLARMEAVMESLEQYEQGVKIGRREGMAKLDQAWQRIYDLFEKPNSQAHDEVLFDVNHGERSAIHWALSEIEKLGGMDPSKRSKK